MSGKVLLPAVGAAVLVAGGAAAYLYFKGPAKDGTTALAIAKAVPDEAYLTAFISSDLQSWAKLREFGSPEAQQVVGGGLKSLEQDLLAKNKINFEKEVLPWVGNSMIALLPNPKNTQKPSVLAVVTIRDKIAAAQFAGKLASEGGGKTKESDYKGNKVVMSEDGSTHTTVVKDYLLIASDQATIEAAINTTQGEPSLAAKPGAESVFAKGVEVQNPIAHIYMLDYATAVQKLTNVSDSGSAELPNMKQLKQVQSMVAGIGVENDGLRMKAIVAMSPDAPKFDYKPVPGKVVAQFPAETLALISGGNISQIWSQATEQAKSDPSIESALNSARQSVKTADFDLDKDIFSWMNGEFGMALIPSEQGILSQVGFGGVLVFDTSDRKTAEATLAKLDNLAKSNAVMVQQRDVKGKQVTEWSTPMMPMGAILGHGWLDDDSVFVALGGPMVDVITSKPNQPLDNSDPFKTAIGSLPKQNLGYFYLDMDRTMALVNRFAALSQSPIPAESAAVLNSIKGVGMTSTQVDSSTGQLDFLVALKKSK